MSSEAFSAAERVLSEALERDDEPEIRVPDSGLQSLLRSRDIAISVVAIALFAFFYVANSRMGADADGPVRRWTSTETAWWR